MKPYKFGCMENLSAKVWQYCLRGYVDSLTAAYREDIWFLPPFERNKNAYTQSNLKVLWRKKISIQD